jgi:hypothetical protein
MRSTIGERLPDLQPSQVPFLRHQWFAPGLVLPNAPPMLIAKSLDILSVKLSVR